MVEYYFELTFKLPHGEDPDQYFEALETTCSDAMIGSGQNGYIAFDFTREAKSAKDAIYSAMKDIKKIISGAVLIEASPDLLGISDAAIRLDVSRQYMRKLMTNKSSITPEPVHQGSTVIYHFDEIIKYIQTMTKRDIENSVLEIAETNKKVNLYRQLINSVDSPDTKSNDCINQIIPDDIKTILKNTAQLAG